MDQTHHQNHMLPVMYPIFNGSFFTILYFLYQQMASHYRFSEVDTVQNMVTS